VRRSTLRPVFGPIRALPILIGLMLLAATPGRADDKPPVPLRVQLVLARYQGDKKVSSLPYTLIVNANLGKTSLRIGASPLNTAIPHKCRGCEHEHRL
jgi:hypothetical protein